MIRTTILRITAVLQLFLAMDHALAFTLQPAIATRSMTTTTTTTALDYTTPEHEQDQQSSSVSVRGKPIIHDIHSLDELKLFLEEDDRLTVVKFYATWCKSCKKLDVHYHKLASEWGDKIVARKKVSGRVKFAQIAHAPVTKGFIEALQVPGFPTLQLYQTTTKLWEGAGHVNTKPLQQEIVGLDRLSPSELAELAQERDDGALELAIEDSFYDYSFLDEEW